MMYHYYEGSKTMDNCGYELNYEDQGEIPETPSKEMYSLSQDLGVKLQLEEIRAEIIRIRNSARSIFYLSVAIITVLFLAILAISIAVLLKKAGRSDDHCPTDFSMIFESCGHSPRCYHSSSSNMSWPEARQYCLDKGSNLASILSLDEQKSLKSSLNNSQADLARFEHWIGMEGKVFRFSNDQTSPLNETRYSWIDGSAAEFFFFEDSALKNDFCVAMSDAERDFRWSDESCSERRLALCKVTLKRWRD